MNFKTLLFLTLTLIFTSLSLSGCGSASKMTAPEHEQEISEDSSISVDPFVEEMVIESDEFQAAENH